MKYVTISMTLFVLFIVTALAETQQLQQQFPLKAERIWSRDSGAATLKIAGDAVNIESSVAKDWAVSLSNNIPVEAGDVFVLSGTIKNLKLPKD